MALLIRSALLTGGFLLLTIILIAHGTRGIIALVIIVVLATFPRTAIWRRIEATLTRWTGSRQGAYFVVALAVILTMAAIAFYQTTH